VAVDVVVETVVDRAPEVVAAYASDPANAPQWYANIRSVEWQGDPIVAVGSRVAFVAQFLGRRLAYTYEITELSSERLVMRTEQGPFPMETTYTWTATTSPAGVATLMTLRNRGEPSGFGSLTAPMMSRAMRRATTKDLARLKALLEATPT
jgi:hypothetical protein